MPTLAIFQLFRGVHLILIQPVLIGLLFYVTDPIFFLLEVTKRLYPPTICIVTEKKV
jgi:hypothetical protein